MDLRPYQKEAVSAIKTQWDSGFKNTLLVLPTGTGKTVVFSKVVEEEVKDGSRALILAHRGELLDQASDKLKMACGLDSALEKAESTSIGSPLKVTVASVQTLSQEKRLSKFPRDYFKTIVVDEAHHSMSDTYQRVLQYFDAANILGVTATPDRSDQKSLGKFFNSKAYEYTMHQAVKDGYLCPVKAQMIPLELDIAKVGISNGDYAVGEIGGALEPYLNQIAIEMLNYCKGRKTVVFLPLVKTSQKFCDLLNVHGLKVVEVNGNSADRDEILRDFENGEYDVLCNSMLLTEGWDCPSVDTVVVLRPTKVRSLYQQMVGRGMRLSPGKKELLLLDFLWMTERHDLCRPSALISKDENIAKRIGASYSGNSVFASKLVCGDCGGFYGRKIWHSTSSYAKVVYRCNSKYDKEHEKCQTPALSEDEVKEKFVKAYNLIMVDKEAVIEDVKEVINLLADTSDLDGKIEDLQGKMEVISGLVEKLVRDNAKTAQDQIEYAKKYENLKSQYDTHKAALEKALEDRSYKQAQEVKMKAYLADMIKADNYLPEWSDDVWMTMVEKATVNRDRTISFKFTSGKEITL